MNIPSVSELRELKHSDNLNIQFASIALAEHITSLNAKGICEADIFTMNNDGDLVGSLKEYIHTRTFLQYADRYFIPNLIELGYDVTIVNNNNKNCSSIVRIRWELGRFTNSTYKIM